jgi:hypothetical protein
MRRGLWLISYFGGRVLGPAGFAAEFAMADDANRSMAARRSTATEALSNQSMSLVRPVPANASGGPRPPPGQARLPSRTRYRAVRSAFGGPHVVVRKARHQNGRESPYARGHWAWEFSCSGDAMAFPRQSNRSTPNVAKNKTLRDRAFREIACSEIAW